MYYVYAGSYTVEANALEQAYELFKHGYDVIGVRFIFLDKRETIRLQVGAFVSKENAIHFIGILNSSGFSAFYEYYEEEKGTTEWQLKYLTQN